MTINAVLYSASSKISESLLKLAEYCELDPLVSECFDVRSSVRIPYSSETSAELALVYGPVLVPSLELCIPVIRMKFLLSEIENKLLKDGIFLRRTALVIPSEMLWDRTENRNSNIDLFYYEDIKNHRHTVSEIGKYDNVVLPDMSGFDFDFPSGVKVIKIKPDAESFAYSLKEAQNALNKLWQERELQSRLEAYMESSFVGHIETDRRGMIVNINRKAQVMLNFHGSVLSGRYVLNVFPWLDKDIFESALKFGFPITGVETGTRDNRFVVNIEPVSVFGEIKGTVISFRRIEASVKENDLPESSEPLKATFRFSDFSYTGNQFSTLVRKAKLAANTDLPILITGEKGTEVIQFAQAIHNESRREDRAYLGIECGVLSDEQIVSTLFEEKNGEKCGVELCRGGTIFVNKIEKLSPKLQFRIYILMTGWYIPEGNKVKRPADVRIIAASELKLRDCVNKGMFREDLFLQLSTLSLNIPSLRDRKEDIPEIIKSMIEIYSTESGRNVSLSAGALKFLSSYDWPGNVVQADNICRRLVYNSAHKTVGEEFVRELMKEALDTDVISIEEKNDNPGKHSNPEAQRIIDALSRNNGNKMKTAAELGISKATLWRHMQKYNISAFYN